MAIKGLSIPVFGKYNYNEATGKVNYSGGMINPHAIEYSLTAESTEANPLHGDNMIIENDVPMFNGGTLALTVDDQTQDVAEYILGVRIVEKTYGSEGKTVKVAVYDSEQKQPFLGFGLIEEHQIKNKDRYRAVILKKIQFSNPEDAASTRGTSIEWQTKALEAAVMRSEENTEEGKHPWKEEAWFDSESEAILYLKWALGVGKVEELAVTSEEGTEAGTTKITVEPEKKEGSTYFYEIGLAENIPEYNADCTGMMEWDGQAEITAEAGQEILIVECENGLARKAGIQTVTVKEG